MTNRYTVSDRWIKDNCIGKLLNFDFNTVTDATLCCDFLNRIEKEKKNNAKLADKLLRENEQLKKALWCIRKRYGYTVEEFIEDFKDNGIDLTKADLE